MDPRLYHAHHQHYTEDLPFWRELAARQGDPILELGCGTGRVLLPLVKAGHTVFGVDNDAAMLAFLSARLAPEQTNHALMLLADMDDFQLAERFPLVLLPCNTYSVLTAEVRGRVLNIVAQLLAPGGMFAVSMPNPTLLADLPAEGESELELEFTVGEDAVQVYSAWQRAGDALTFIYDYDRLLADGLVERHTVQTTHRLVSAEQHEGELAAAGLRITETYGDFDKSAYTADSPHLIFLATIT
ncbi:MAG: class I SAM-dependent methyltransferase [Anaerolineales bacterium]|nr:class I SAM-dependent methyltransferase [Anaerolineales bacterium]